ncbi:protein FAR1-RELATED SEQUENCE 5-like [Humulus lupulus]|uniref:protein FAR1-RELATED SEQUENCE 5-like n=1 Tax=Humulus lupulus TaxID=3486 RepID=UPI002B407F94|nr:protein FAR1-RELATED SEQUENCE 5-like [Humulus lupulus]
MDESLKANQSSINSNNSQEEKHVEKSYEDFDHQQAHNEEDDNDCKDAIDINVNDKVVEPSIGMMFNSIDELLEYYRKYGNQFGFEVGIRSSTKGDDGELKYVSMACTRNGKPTHNSSNALKLYPSIKIDCKAKIRAKICSSKTVQVVSFVLDHNHELSTPRKVRYHKVNRIIQSYVKKNLEINDRAGIRPNKNFNSFVVEMGGHDKVPFLEKDCRNLIAKVRRLRLGGGDDVTLQKYFMKMQSDNANFFYVMDLDEKSRIKNIFWADARSKAAYEEFGDVVSFATTYLTNKYDMPFAAFVGVNHHGQSTLLGCALLSNEDTKIFIWLFESWLACMSNHAPNAIITDQDKAMQNAIEITFPNTRHRWCLWHIMKKILEKLKGYTQYKSIKSSLSNVVCETLTKNEFEEKWMEFIKLHELHANEWLLGIYNERKRWVPTFVKDTFWAGMSTTQRSESMNAFFDGYVNSKTTLKQFVEQYENALRDKVEKENHENFNSFNLRISCITMYAMEKQYQDAYTTSKFKEIQQEFKGKLYCEISSYKDINETISEFVVAEDVLFGDHNRCVSFMVNLNKENSEVNCNCQLFEFKGILCGHAISVLIHKKFFVFQISTY